MYIPSDYIHTDRAEIISFMKEFSFATIVTAKNEFPIATHLPFIVSENDDKIILSSHFAKANPQWKQIENKAVLVIFSEPNAYISPKHYEKEQNVPTWNYIAVHAYGKGKLIKDTEQSFEVLQKTIITYEKEYMEQWKKLPDAYKSSLQKGIMAFEINVTNIQAKSKLSQDKTKNEQQNIINTLSKSKKEQVRLIAEYMNKKSDG